MSPALPINQLGSDDWNAKAYQAVAVAYRIAAAARSTTVSYVLSRKLWNLDKRLKLIQEEFYKPPQADRPRPQRDQIEAGIKAVKALHETFEHLANTMRSKGLYNQSLLSSPMNSAMGRIEDIVEFAHTVEVSLDPEETAAVDAVFDEALGELQRGETLSMESIL
jgi:hypothetical protein